MEVGRFIIVLYYNIPSSKFPLFRLNYGVITSIKDSFIFYNPWIDILDQEITSFTVKPSKNVYFTMEEYIIGYDSFSWKIFEEIILKKYEYKERSIH